MLSLVFVGRSCRAQVFPVEISNSPTWFDPSTLKLQCQQFLAQDLPSFRCSCYASGRRRFIDFCTQLGKLSQSGFPCLADKWISSLTWPNLCDRLNKSLLVLVAASALHNPSKPAASDVTCKSEATNMSGKSQKLTPCHTGRNSRHLWSSKWDSAQKQQRRSIIWQRKVQSGHTTFGAYWRRPMSDSNCFRMHLLWWHQKLIHKCHVVQIWFSWNSIMLFLQWRTRDKRTFPLFLQKG